MNTPTRLVRVPCLVIAGDNIALWSDGTGTGVMYGHIVEPEPINHVVTIRPRRGDPRRVLTIEVHRAHGQPLCILAQDFRLTKLRAACRRLGVSLHER